MLGKAYCNDFFKMIQFKPISLEDKALFNRFFESVNYRICDFAFANLFCWQKQYSTTFAVVDDFLLIRYICDDGLPCYMMPVGNGDLKKILLRMLELANASFERFRIHAVTADMFADIDAALPHTFFFTPQRDYFEYIYLSADLIELKGKKYQSKRNHINRFKINYPEYKFVPFSPELVPACKALYQKWLHIYNDTHDEKVLFGEQHAVYEALANVDYLDLQGLVLFVGNEAVAFTLGQQVTNDTFVVFVEKALIEYQGAYQFINNAFIKAFASQVTYVNREEDLGILSLRQAKMSYHPVKFLERGSVCLK